MVFALNQIAAAILIFSGNALRYVNCGCLPSAVQCFVKISVEFRCIVEFLYKGFNFCVNWILDLMQANLLLAGCFWDFFSTHSLLRSTLGETTHNLGNPVVLKGDLLLHWFRRTSAFSAPSWTIYHVKNTINLTNGLSSGCVAQWKMRCSYTSKASGSPPAGWDLFLFFLVVLFCFVLFLF